ncbi:Rho termination factor N-terminal domain-containing protein, partial [Puerhibacterium puerhi]|uniref:Rho termination factor N-terminal domain-containing protein n=1 Tax=Puerhibacterium puerhi TaxID=2692623 RepID=UPI0019156C4E
MTNTTETRSTSGSLSSMRLAELQAMASQMGVKGTSKMRKGDLVEAIRTARSGGQPDKSTAAAPAAPAGDGSAERPQ